MNNFGFSDKGRYRSENQDAFAIRPLDGCVLAVVCDGMGGAAAGRLASGMAVDVFVSFAEASLAASHDAEDEDILREAANAANRGVYEFAGTSEEYAGMGTTLVAGIFRPDHASLVNVGDSRAYCVSNGGVVQLTKDHSLVQQMVDSGELTREQARRHPRRNIITRAVGSEAFVTSDTYSVPVREGDRFLLCTDGLTNAVDDDELQRIVMAAPDAQRACSALVEAALNNNTRDNVTAIVICPGLGGDEHGE